jgi:hypothetical protein
VITLSEVSSSRGAPMGRHQYHAHGMDDLEFELERVPLVDGAYDCGGAYWGSPDNLWAARAELDGEELAFFFVRADDDEMACLKVKDEYPEATFKPQTGSVIEQTIAFLQRYLDGLAPEDRDPAESTQEEIDQLQSELDDIRWNLKHHKEPT